MADKLAELAELAQGLSIDELRLLLRFAEFLAKELPWEKGSLRQGHGTR